MKKNNQDDLTIQLLLDEKSHNIENIINSVDEDCTISSNAEQSLDRRKNSRKEINLSGVAKLTMDSNEVLFLPVMIKNISHKGMLLALHDKGYVFVNMLKRIEEITVSFSGDDNNINTVRCKTKHIQLRENLNIGVEMLP